MQHLGLTLRWRQMEVAVLGLLVRREQGDCLGWREQTLDSWGAQHPLGLLSLC